MNCKSFGRGAHLFCLAIAAALAGTLASAASAQEENLGQSRQAIVSGPPVSEAKQEELGLLTLSGRCSAALLTNDLAITAAHCIHPEDISNPAQVTLTANWGGVQTRRAREVRSLGPTPDIALIMVANPFRVNGSFKGYRREIAREEDYYTLRTYGRGISVLATGSGASATPAQSDGQYRSAEVAISRLEQNLYWFPRNGSGQIVAGGDSGGPSFANVRGRTVLLGVHATCRALCLPGQTCTPGAWTWISEITECGDAPVYSAYGQIVQAMNESANRIDVSRPADERGAPHVEGTSNSGLRGGRFNTWTTPAGVVSYIYAVGPDGGLEWRRHDGAESGLPQWQSPLPVGSGWEGFRHVFSGGRNIIYAVNQEGDLLWYRHNVAYNVPRGGRRRAELDGPRVVGRGWQNFRHVFSAGDGVIYAVAQDGNLLWYKHNGYSEAVEMPADAGLRPELTLARAQAPWVKSWEDVNPRVVGRGWGDFRHVFSGGGGVIYAITQDGTLVRYRHVAYLQGRGAESAGAWEGPVTIRSGWGGYQQVFSSGGGAIYAVAPDGRLLWFKDRVPRTGSVTGKPAVTGGATLGMRRLSPRKVDDGWGRFLKVFALMPSAPDAIR